MITDVVLSGDEHVGGATGLVPSSGFKLKDGEVIPPSPIQRRIARHWDETWAEILARHSKKRKLVVIRMGDGVEGRHHDSAEIYGTYGDHLRNLEDVYAPIAKVADEFYTVRGTDVHVGENGDYDDLLARHLNTSRVKVGVYSAYHLRLNIDGVRFDVAHKGPNPGKLPWTEGTSVRSYARGIALRDIAHGVKPPQVVARAHFHRKARERMDIEGHVVWGCVSPSWQAKTPYANSVASEQHLAHIGLLVVTVEGGAIVGEPEFRLLEWDETPEIVIK